MTGPYAPVVEQLIRGPLEHLWSVAVSDAAGQPIPLDVLACEVAFEEGWWPHVQGRLTAKVSDDQSTLDRLDPRAKVRVDIEAGYRLPDGARDLHPLAGCWLVSRSTVRPDDTLDLAFAGAEYLGSRAFEIPNLIAIAGKAGWSVSTHARDAVNACLVAVGAVTGPGGWDYANASVDTGWSGSGEDAYGVQLPAQGAAPLQVAADIASLAGAWLYADGAGVWHMPEKPTTATGSARHQLKVGENGTIVDSSTTVERGEDWANAVLVEAPWYRMVAGKPEEQEPRWGRAWLTSGPYRVSVVPPVCFKLERRVHTFAPQTSLDRMARNVLAKRVTLGRSLTVSAVAAYWLRVPDTVTVQLPLGDQERVLVSAVAYQLDTGRMTIRTRLPENVTGITIGG